MKFEKMCLGTLLALIAVSSVRAEVSQIEFEAIKKELAEMREKAAVEKAEKAAATAEVQTVKKAMLQMQQEMNGLKGADAPVVSEVDKMLAPQCVTDQPVTTGVGKLKMGGLVQVWYYAIERDTKGLFSLRGAGSGALDHNFDVSQNTFQIRRAEINFTMDIHENVTAYVMTDFARETDSAHGQFANLAGSNQGYIKGPGGPFALSGGPFGVDNKLGAPVGQAPAILQDAVINFHDLIPHHDLTVGQMLPYVSQEDFDPNGNLDFVERSWIGNFYPRDTGVVLHGAWWCDGGGSAYEGAGNTGRLQYWLGLFDSPGYYQDADTQGRADDNSSKDFLGRLMIRPLWDDCWGHLELSGASGFGKHGSTPRDQEANDYNNQADPIQAGAHKTTGQRWAAFAEYRTGSFATGLWFKYEYGWTKDSLSTVPMVTGLPNLPNSGVGPPLHYEPFTTTGCYVSTGYNLGKTHYADCLPCWARGFEFDARFQHYTNVWTQDPVVIYKADTYATNQGTFGINYYIKGHNAKVQMNYDIVRDPRGNADFRFHAVKNDFFSMNFQVMW